MSLVHRHNQYQNQKEEENKIKYVCMVPKLTYIYDLLLYLLFYSSEYDKHLRPSHYLNFVIYLPFSFLYVQDFGLSNAPAAPVKSGIHIL